MCMMCRCFKRHIHANRLNGVDNEWLTPEQAKAFCPPLNIDPRARYPVVGAHLQRRGGTARHDAVAWGYARARRPIAASTSSRIAKSPASAAAPDGA
jgi:glycine/D-amino acid oxidase-like deaminating enzyme